MDMFSITMEFVAKLMNFVNNSILLLEYAKHAILDIPFPLMAVVLLQLHLLQIADALHGKTMSVVPAQLDIFSTKIRSVHLSVIIAENGAMMAHALAAIMVMML